MATVGTSVLVLFANNKIFSCQSEFMQAKDGSTNVIWSKFCDLFGKFENYQKFENHLKFLPGKFVQGRVSVGTSVGFVSMSSPPVTSGLLTFQQSCKKPEKKSANMKLAMNN